MTYNCVNEILENNIGYIAIDSFSATTYDQFNKAFKNLKNKDNIKKVLKHGTLTEGFIGLAECLKALTGKHHGESKASQELGLKIIKFMRDRTDEYAKEYKLNFSLIATPAEGLSGRFTNIDKAIYGIIPGVTDRAYYTNSFHVPVYYDISVFDKIFLTKCLAQFSISLSIKSILRVFFSNSEIWYLPLSSLIQN